MEKTGLDWKNEITKKIKNGERVPMSDIDAMREANKEKQDKLLAKVNAIHKQRDNEKRAILEELTAISNKMRDSAKKRALIQCIGKIEKI